MNDNENIPEQLPVLDIYTDGSGDGGQGPGGWGCVAQNATHEMTYWGSDLFTTNNRMEMTAVLEVLKTLKGRYAVTAHTDSRYVVDGMTKYLAGWKARGWRKADGDPVLNKDLWVALEAACERHQVHWQWIKGHAKHTQNDHADKLANMAREEQSIGQTKPKRRGGIAAA